MWLSMQSLRMRLTDTLADLPNRLSIVEGDLLDQNVDVIVDVIKICDNLRCTTLKQQLQVM